MNKKQKILIRIAFFLLIFFRLYALDRFLEQSHSLEVLSQVEDSQNSSTVFTVRFPEEIPSPFEIQIKQLPPFDESIFESPQLASKVYSLLSRWSQSAGTPTSLSVEWVLRPEYDFHNHLFSFAAKVPIEDHLFFYGRQIFLNSSGLLIISVFKPFSEEALKLFTKIQQELFAKKTSENKNFSAYQASFLSFLNQAVLPDAVRKQHKQEKEPSMENFRLLAGVLVIGSMLFFIFMAPTKHD